MVPYLGLESAQSFEKQQKFQHVNTQFFTLMESQFICDRKWEVKTSLFKSLLQDQTNTFYAT